jgi:hypothetical protein
VGGASNESGHVGPKDIPAKAARRRGGCRQQGAASCRYLFADVRDRHVLSFVFHLLGTSVSYQVIDPETHKAVTTTAVVNNLLSAEGIRFIITSTIRNFLGFTPVGKTLSPWWASAWRKRPA